MSNIPPIEPIKVLAAAIQAELSLSANQILLGFENFPIPETLGLFVSLEYGVEQIVGASNQNDVNTQDEYEEVQTVSMLHQIEIDVLSYDSSARTRKEEVIMALSSYNAQQLMEVNQMRIASIPNSFITVTSPEPSKQLNRYRYTVSVYALHQKNLVTPYYDSISTVQLIENP